MLVSREQHVIHDKPYVWYVGANLSMQGDTSSQSEPGRYLQAVQFLCNRYYAEAAAAAATGAGAAAAAGGSASGPLLLPLVINTPGWITGLGLELLGEVLRCAQPTHGRCDRAGANTYVCVMHMHLIPSTRVFVSWLVTATAVWP